MLRYLHIAAILMLLLLAGCATKLEPERCSFEQGFFCEQHTVVNGDIRMWVTNERSEPVTFDSLVLSNDEVTCTAQEADVSGSRATFTANCDPELPAGTSTLQTTLTWTSDGTEQSAAGSLTIKN